MQAEIISVGDELLIGQVVNTNASFIGERLSATGVRVARITAVGDERDAMLAAFDRAWNENDVVIVTGGLGPTKDDITRGVTTEFFDTTLVYSDQVFEDITRVLAHFQRPLSNLNRDQALVPASCTVLRNFEGTAPGYHFAEGDRHFFVLPGVPFEMKAMIDDQVLPILAAEMREHRCAVTLLTTGIPESMLASRIAAVDVSDVALAYLPSPLGVRLRITAFDAVRERADARVLRVRTAIAAAVGEYIFGEGAVTLEAVIGDILAARNLTLAVAESCTGGTLADMVTNVPGSSRYFMGGAVTYSNESKADLVGVDPDIIRRRGAVSDETARAMAAGVRRRFGTTFGLSTTGIAGPDGATPDKPVGLVWIGVSTPEATRSFQCFFGGDRIRTKVRAAQTALDLLRRTLLHLPPGNTFVHSTGTPQ